MRLTADLILKAPNFLNPLKQRELDLRGNKLTVIENLGATQDANDCIDLSDNQIAILENFPLLSRLSMLLISNNKISKIAIGLGETLQNLESLILTNNKLLNLSDIDSLSELPRLKRLCLLENLITKKPHYRLYVISKLPKLKQLDFKKIKDQERQSAEKMFPSNKKSKVTSSSNSNNSTTMTTKTTTPNVSEIQKKAEKQALEIAAREKAKEAQAIKNAISTASSLAEVDRLTQALQTGGLPEDSNMEDK